MSFTLGQMEVASWEEHVHATRKDWHALAIRAAELRTHSEEWLHLVFSGHGITQTEADKLIAQLKSIQQHAEIEDEGLESFLLRMYSDQAPSPSWEEMPELVTALHQEWERALFYLEKGGLDSIPDSSRNRRELKVVREQNGFQPARTLPGALFAPLPIIARLGDQTDKSSCVSPVDVLLATPAELEGDENKTTLDERLSDQLQHYLQVSRVLTAFFSAWTDQVEILRETSAAETVPASEPEPEPELVGWRFWHRLGSAPKPAPQPVSAPATWADPYPSNVPVETSRLRQLCAWRKQTAEEAKQLKEAEEYLTARVAQVQADLAKRNEDWKRHQTLPADLDQIGSNELANTERLLGE